MLLCTGSVLALETRSIVEDTSTTIINIQNGSGKVVGNMTHYSTFGAAPGGSTPKVLSNAIFNVTPSGSTTWTYKPSDRMACAAGYYGSSTYTNYDCHNY